MNNFLKIHHKEILEKCQASGFCDQGTSVNDKWEVEHLPCQGSHKINIVYWKVIQSNTLRAKRLKRQIKADLSAVLRSWDFFPVGLQEPTEILGKEMTAGDCITVEELGDSRPVKKYPARARKGYRGSWQGCPRVALWTGHSQT